MPSEVKWIKLVVGMFDGESFKKIKRATIGGKSFRDKLTAVWFELLDLAGKYNRGGYLVNSKGIPLNVSDIAIQIDREEEEVKLCLDFFSNDGMIEILDDSLCVASWTQYQNIEGMDKIREQSRVRMQKYRERKKLNSPEKDECYATVTQQLRNVTHLEEEREEELDIDTLSIYLPENEKEKTDKETEQYLLKHKQIRKHGGKIGDLVQLSDEQIDSLLEVLSIEEFHHYCDAVQQCEEKGKHYGKTHYKAILDMANKDRSVNV